MNISKELLTQYLTENLTQLEMSIKLSCSRAHICRLFKRFGLTPLKHKNTKFLDGCEKRFGVNSKMENYDWKLIQIDYDNLMSRKEISEKYKIPTRHLSRGIKKGLLSPRTKEQVNLIRSKKQKGTKHSDESKKKMSNIRKEYLKLNNKPAWKTHDKFKSRPCEWLKKELTNRGYKFIPELSPLLEQGRFYSVDIAFPERKFIIEVNGRQHYNPDGTLAPYYQTRHDLIEKEGWEIWEVPYSQVNKSKFIDLVIHTLTDKKIYPH